MGFIDAARSISWKRVWYVILALIPYVDLETIGVVPLLRDITPYVDPIYVTKLSWTERGRLVALILVPVVDGEVLALFGIELEEVISD